jgi:hypothetical protein
MCGQIGILLRVKKAESHVVVLSQSGKLGAEKKKLPGVALALSETVMR